ncbi:hypothetical protein [Winogradskyella sp.]|uniref:hypothetical protein n=1 Tax=Winogradskyella sp. TaxID=1883156 RepID=UPI00260EF091|nr:hypothetical protein [Winogradskyella sp.]
MKKLVFILMVSIGLFSCKNEPKEKGVNLEESRAKSYDQNDGLVTMKGEFLYDADKKAAVFQTPNEIYGVVVNDNMHLLNEKVKAFKADEYTSVPVTIRVKRIENTDQAILWDNILEVKDILKVEAPDPNKKDVVKLAN